MLLVITIKFPNTIKNPRAHRISPPKKTLESSHAICWNSRCTGKEEDPLKIADESDGIDGTAPFKIATPPPSSSPPVEN